MLPANYYDENNAYTYRWDVQHNIADLINLFGGGNEAFVTTLDETFTEPLGRSKYEFYAQLPDQTGNVGHLLDGERTVASHSIPLQLCRGSHRNPKDDPTLVHLVVQE